MISLIGISGRIGSGKSAIADILVRDHGFTCLSMADALRAETSQALSSGIAPHVAPTDVRRIIQSGWSADAVYAKPTPPEMRRLLQWWGCWRRTINPDYWTKKALARIEATSSPVVIPDIRFENEGDLVHALDGELWLAKRPSPGTYGADLLDHHESERFARENRDWDMTIENDGSLADLEDKVMAALGFVPA